MKPLTRVGRATTRHRRARYAAIAVMLGLAVATAGHGTAWADTSGTDSPDSSVSRSESAGTGAAAAAKDSSSSSGPRAVAGSSRSSSGIANGSATENDTGTDTLDKSRATTPAVEDDLTGGTDGPAGDDTTPSTDPDESASTDVEAKSEALEQDSTTTSTAAPAEPSTPAKAADSKKSVAAESEASTTATVGELRATASSPTSEDEKSSGLADPASSAGTDLAPAAGPLAALTAASPAAAATPNTATVDVAPVTPGPVSPIAEFVALPGRIVNTVLQLVGITTAANIGPSPISPAPLAELFFAVFRRLEEVVGLDSPLSGQPVPPALVYDGPLDIPTPTVAQFLNASATEYVLGGTPGGLAPFTVDGWPMTSLHLETGSDASVWVTPQNQIIIAYSGTTGGTNLLFNPLIALTQILTDVQAAFSDETPQAFTQALDFAQEVQAEAAKQGYAPDDIFVTGHSLGAWQAQYVAQQIGLNGIGFEGPGLSSTVAGNGADSLFVNTATYGDMAGFLASDLPGLYPLAPPYVPGGGLKPHYGPIVLLGDPNANTPMVNAAGLFGKGIVGTLIAAVDLFGNFFAKHLPGVQAYHLDVVSDPGVVPWLGINEGPVYTGFGELTIPEFLKAASDAGILVAP